MKDYNFFNSDKSESEKNFLSVFYIYNFKFKAKNDSHMKDEKYVIQQYFVQNRIYSDFLSKMLHYSTLNNSG